MAGTIIVSSIKTDTDNSFIVRSNTGATLFSVDTTSISIPDGSITSAMIANGTVIAADVADGSITTSKIADGNVTNAKIDSVANTKITGNIISSQIASDITLNGNTNVTTLVAGAGSNTAPAITTSGDTNTGMFFPAADTIAFAEGGTESVRLDSSGQLLMNMRGGYDSNATGAITLNANAPDGTVNFKKGIVFSSDGGDNPFVWAHAGITSTGSPGFDGNLIFGTDGSGTQTSTITERMRIDSSGRLFLGGTSVIAGYQFIMYHNDTGGMAYKYNGTSEQNSCSFQNGNGQVGRIYTSGSSTTYATSSDYRLKENIVPMTGALDKVTQLNPVTYTWKTDGSAGQGFIAHELQAVVPDCVGGTKDAVDAEGNPIYQDIDTSFLVATLTAAIKEQQTIINNLKTRIEALEGQ